MVLAKTYGDSGEAGDEATERLTDCLPVDGASI